MGLDRLAPDLVLAGKWRLRRRIGRGGMGEVWVAVHRSLEQEVAVKVLDRDAFGEDLYEEAKSRFHLEAQVAADLSRRTRHIAKVIDHGDDEGLDYLVMELLVGDSLEDLLQRDGRMERVRVAEIVRQAARGLAVAHADNVVHRDLKPANIFLTRDDEGQLLVKLLDFGIAKARARASNGPPSTHRTRAGVLLGTAAYMSPEQARGLEIDARIDVWALACVAYELLTGAMPFLAENDIELLMKICTTQPAAPSTLVPSVPAEVDAVFDRAFASRIDERWPDARSFADALVAAVSAFPLVVPAAGVRSDAAVIATPPAMPVYEPRKGAPLLAIAAGVLLLLAGVAIFATRTRDVPPAVAAPVVVETPAKAPSPPPSVAPAATPSETAIVSAPSVGKTPKSTPRPKPSTTATTTKKQVDQGEIF